MLAEGGDSKKNGGVSPHFFGWDVYLGFGEIVINI
jgi:hypothetical protein